MLSKQPKFYFFDNGISRASLDLLSKELSPNDKGLMFEQFLMNEVRKVIEYKQSDLRMRFWRTKKGAEVDLLLIRGKEIVLAAEFKSNTRLIKSDFSGLLNFKKSYPLIPLVLVAPVDKPSVSSEGIDVLTPEDFINKVKEI